MRFPPTNLKNNTENYLFSRWSNPHLVPASTRGFIPVIFFRRVYKYIIHARVILFFFFVVFYCHVNKPFINTVMWSVPHKLWFHWNAHLWNLTDSLIFYKITILPCSNITSGMWLLSASRADSLRYVKFFIMDFFSTYGFYDRVALFNCEAISYFFWFFLLIRTIDYYK